MKYFLLFVSVFFVWISSAQISDCNLNANRLKILDYISENLVQLRNKANHDMVMVKLKFSESGVIENVALFQDSHTADDESFEIKNLENLAEFIRQRFFFCPTIDFENTFGMYSELSFRLPLTKSGLEEFREGIDETIAELPVAKQIVLGSAYSVKVNVFEVNKVKSPKTTIKRKLNLYNSGIIEFAPNYFMSFNVINSSDAKDARLVNYVEYKIYRVVGTKATLLESDRRKVYDGRVNLSQSIVQSSDDVETGSFVMDVDIVFETPDR
ncbi:MAG: hypothetical protein EOO50_12430 [Flavobacterium sp.]|uniref:hypothetical protein n=1 Tax=Flavobacterium sp. TaxID=239 RepID=UPI00121D19FB|nr:hypothetical protein [Flavobacterium sp.]RZJ65814.1 MAG: hypothetical protein EOO50_12430 [Flavobacterium sp.]